MDGIAGKVITCRQYPPLKTLTSLHRTLKGARNVFQCRSASGQHQTSPPKENTTKGEGYLETSQESVQKSQPRGWADPVHSNGRGFTPPPPKYPGVAWAPRSAGTTWQGVSQKDGSCTPFLWFVSSGTESSAQVAWQGGRGKDGPNNLAPRQFSSFPTHENHFRNRLQCIWGRKG